MDVEKCIKMWPQSPESHFQPGKFEVIPNCRDQPGSTHDMLIPFSCENMYNYGYNVLNIVKLSRGRSYPPGPQNSNGIDGCVLYHHFLHTFQLSRSTGFCLKIEYPRSRWFAIHLRIEMHKTIAITLRCWANFWTPPWPKAWCLRLTPNHSPIRIIVFSSI